MKVRGVFETMRVKEGKVVYFDEHIARLNKSCLFFKITLPCSGIKLKRLIQRVIKNNSFKDARLKVIARQVNRKADIQIEICKYRPYPSSKYREGFSVMVSPFRQKELKLSRHKRMGRLLYDLSLEEAKRKGCDEALILNKSGHLAEASRSNIFFVKDDKLFTPSLACGCLEGISRMAVMEIAKKNKIKVRQGKFSLEDLVCAPEAFLTNSLIGIMPIKRKCGPITKLLIKKYSCLSK